MTEFKAFVRNSDLGQEAEIDDFQALDLVPRFNGVGTWVLDIDARTRPAQYLTQPGYGIDVMRRDGPGRPWTSFFGGRLRHRGRSYSDRKNRLVVAGVDDNWLLHARLAHPQPATAAPPYNVNTYDIRTGVASTVLRAYVNVNAGPGALTARQWPALVLAADPVLGPSITGRGRWQNLLVLLQSLALRGGGLGFRVVRTDPAPTPPTLSFEVYQPEDRTETAHFSLGLGNLLGFDYDDDAPEATYVVAGGSGEAAARLVREGSDATALAEWGRIEAFRDRRDIDNAPELDEAITEELAEKAHRGALSFNPIDLLQLQYGRDYDLGDQVLAVIDDVEVADVVREVSIAMRPGEPTRAVPAIGAVDASSVENRLLRRLFARVGRLGHGIENLERR